MGTVRERQLKQQEYEEALARRLREAKLKAPKKEPKRKEPSVINSMLVGGLADDHIIRPLSAFTNRSYNQDKQVADLIRHLYVKYPVPFFMYDVMRKDYKAKHGMHADYILWFLALAQGQSFTKLVKPHMTAKEAHVFLSAPSNCINENVWWAKLKVAGIPVSLNRRLIERIFKNRDYKKDVERMNELIHFFANYHHELDKDSTDEIIDFIVWKLGNEPEFRFKGRTASSMVKMSNEWHELMQRAKLGKHVEWNSMGIPRWEYFDKTTMWVMEELCTNKELAAEGKKQRHCVYGYVNSCLNGQCHIFSLRSHYAVRTGEDAEGNPQYHVVDETGRVTIEIRGSNIVQVRRHLNAPATPQENYVLRMWAGSKGIGFGSRW